MVFTQHGRKSARRPGREIGLFIAAIAAVVGLQVIGFVAGSNPSQSVASTQSVR